MKAILHTDGGSRGNPGPAGLGVVITDATSGALLYEAGHFLGTATNNVAEYTALLRGLDAAVSLGIIDIEVRSDSQLMVRQLLGEYRVKSADLKPLFEQAKQGLNQFNAWRAVHVLRDKNKRADELANKAMDARGDVGGQRASTTPPAEPQAANASQDSTPCFEVELAGKAGRCIVGNGPGNAYPLGPTTCEGLCMHAAAAALADGPLTWPAHQTQGETNCQACGQKLRLTTLATR